MAKLSQKRARRLAFVASKLALSYDQDERMALLAELLDELGIDQEQREDSAASAARHLRYEASRRRQRPAKKADDIDGMSLDELRAHNAQLLKRRDELLAKREQRPDIDAMSDEERAAYQQHLMRSIAAKLEPSPAPAPDPEPTVEEAPTLALPTKKMEQAIARFDDLTDGEQVDALRGMWGQP